MHSVLLMFTHLQRPSISAAHKPVGVHKRCFPVKQKWENFGWFSAKWVKPERTKGKTQVTIEWSSLKGSSCSACCLERMTQLNIWETGQVISFDTALITVFIEAVEYLINPVYQIVLTMEGHNIVWTFNPFQLFHSYFIDWNRVCLQWWTYFYLVPAWREIDSHARTSLS